MTKFILGDRVVARAYWRDDNDPLIAGRRELVGHWAKIVDEPEAEIPVVDFGRGNRLHWPAHALELLPWEAPCPACEQLVPISPGVIHSTCRCGRKLIPAADYRSWQVWKKFDESTCPKFKFQVGDHVRTRRFKDGLHALSFSLEREPYVGAQAEVTEIFEPSVVMLTFPDNVRWLWATEACDFVWRLDLLSEEQAKAQNMIPNKSFSDTELKTVLETYRKNALENLDSNIVLPADQLEQVNQTMNMVQAAFATFANTIQSIVASLQPTLQAIAAAFQPLPSPSDTWHAHALEGGLLPCPSCKNPIPAQLEPSVREGKLCCPVCNHAGVHELCPVCNGILIQSYCSPWNVHERWHCQDCGRRFDGDRNQL
jgi:hypothetical protein